jgi:hypothetical protein
LVLRLEVVEFSRRRVPRSNEERKIVRDVSSEVGVWPKFQWEVPTLAKNCDLNDGDQERMLSENRMFIPRRPGLEMHTEAIL